MEPEYKNIARNLSMTGSPVTGKGGQDPKSAENENIARYVSMTGSPVTGKRRQGPKGARYCAEESWLTSNMDQVHQEEIQICGIVFPKNVVKNRSDFTIGEKLGEGAFGSVYHGHLDIGSFSR